METKIGDTEDSIKTISGITLPELLSIDADPDIPNPNNTTKL